MSLASHEDSAGAQGVQPRPLNEDAYMKDMSQVQDAQGRRAAVPALLWHGSETAVSTVDLNRIVATAAKVAFSRFEAVPSCPNSALHLSIM